MSITAYRYRAADGLVVLQVQEANSYGYGTSIRDYTWRDAKVEDLLEVARLQLLPEPVNRWPTDPAA